MLPTYRPLPDAYRKHGFDYRLVRRTPRVALYEQSDAGRVVAYEVCRVLRHAGRTAPGGAEVAPAEYLPAAEQWGAHAWTLPTLPAAEARYAEQEALLTARHTS